MKKGQSWQLSKLVVARSQFFRLRIWSQNRTGFSNCARDLCRTVPL